MSSHHIVREKQEPALLIMNLNGFSSENLGQLLEWSPTVIVNCDIYDEADSIGIKIDAVITSDINFVAQANTKIILSQADELEDGLKFLTGEGYAAVNIISDKFSIKDYVLFVDLIDLVIYSQSKKIYPVRSGFSKWLIEDQLIEIVSDARNLNQCGLKKISEKKYQTLKNGFFSLTFNQPFIFISESL